MAFDITQVNQANFNNNIVLCIAEHATGTEYFSSHGYISDFADTPSNQPFKTRMIYPLEINESTDNSVDYGDLTFLYETEREWLDKTWKGYSLKVLVGDASQPLSSFVTLIDGTNGGLNINEATETISFNLYDKMELLNVHMQESTYTNGDKIPVSLGNCFNVTAYLIDDGTGVNYQVHDAACTITAVRDGMVALTAGSGYTDNGDGTLVLNSAPSSKITVDVEQADKTAAQMITYLANKVGFTDLDATNLSNFTNTSILGAFYNREVTALSAIQNISASVGAYAAINTLGLLTITLLDGVNAPTHFFTQYQIKRRSTKTVDILDPSKSVTINYARNWSVADKNALDVAITPDEKERYAKEYLTIKVSNTLTGFPLASDLNAKNTFFTLEADALNETNRLAQLRNIQWTISELTLLNSNFDFVVGDTVSILQQDGSEKIGRIIDARKKLDKKEAQIKLLSQNSFLHEDLQFEGTLIEYNGEQVVYRG